MKKFKHKKTGEIATYENGVLKSSDFCVELGVEPSKEIWEEISKYPEGTKVIDLHAGNARVYEKLNTGKWKTGTHDFFTIHDNQIGEGKRFQLLDNLKNTYKILSFQMINGGIYGTDIVILNEETQCFDWDIEGLKGKSKEGINTFINCFGWRIHSVQRLSDGEIFTLGDKCTSQVNPITGFELEGDTIKVLTKAKGNWQYITSINKIKTPLFKTEDGVNIYENDTFYFLPEHWPNTHDKEYGILKASKNVIAAYAYKRFSTKEAIESYIIMNKPCLSLKNIFDIAHDYDNNTMLLNKKALEKLTKQKIWK